MLHNKNVPMKDRARIVTIEPYHKVNVPWADLGVNAVILPMAGMPLVYGYCKPQAYDTFPGRCAEASKSLAVIGQMELSAANWLKDGNLTEGPVLALLKNNPLVKVLMDAWHDGAWTWDKILSKQGKWRKLAAIEFKAVDTLGYQDALVDAGWQSKVIDTMLERVKYLMDGGFAPNIPVILYTGPWWLAIYDQPDNAINLMLGKYKDWLYLRLGQWTLWSTAEFMTLGDIFKYPPPDDFQFEAKRADGTIYRYPDGYHKRILGHEFSGNKQKVLTISGGEINLTLHCDTPAELRKILGQPELPPGEEGGGEEGGTIPTEAAGQISAFLRKQAAEMIKLADVLDGM